MFDDDIGSRKNILGYKREEKEKSKDFNQQIQENLAKDKTFFEMMLRKNPEIDNVRCHDIDCEIDNIRHNGMELLTLKIHDNIIATFVTATKKMKRQTTGPK